MRSTRYADEVAAADIEGRRIERLLVKEDGRERIRFSWWKNGKFVLRPLQAPEDALLPLIGEAIKEGVFSEPFLRDLEEMLQERPR